MQHTEMLTAIDALLESIRVINSNLNRLTETSEKLYSRINVLEQDLQERSARKRVYRSLLTLYPLLVVILLGLVNLDHYKINTAVKDFNTLTDDLKSLGMFASNSDYQHSESESFGEST